LLGIDPVQSATPVDKIDYEHEYEEGGSEATESGRIERDRKVEEAGGINT
jgi:hypothetical protein